MCKHVAATLYGIGARLDDEPDLFFKLRRVEMKDLATEAVQDKTRKLLRKAKKMTGRVIAEADVANVFGIDMEEPVATYKKRKRVRKKASQGKRASKSVREEIGAKQPEKPTPPKQAKTPFEAVLGVVRRSRKGVSVADIRKKTGLDDQQIRNCIYRAKAQGKVVNQSRGVFVSSALQSNRPSRKAET